jgi:hypothetical protein
MAPVNADVAEVEAQLSALRSRCNALLAQRTVAYALTAVLVAAAAVVGLALRGNARLFAATATAAASAALATVAYCTWRAWRGWQSLPDTARLADAGAALDNRLTTLLAVAPTQPPSPLRPLLVAQLLAARRSWSTDALAPQRLARALALVPLALLIFAAAAFYARPPAEARALRARSTLVAGLPQHPDQETEGSLPKVEQALFSNRADEAGARSEGDRAAMNGSSGRESQTAGDGHDPQDIAGNGSGLESPPVDAAPGALSALQRSIRQTFGDSDRHPDSRAQAKPNQPPGQSGGTDAAARGNQPGNDPDRASTAANGSREMPSPKGDNTQQRPQTDGASTKDGGASSSGRGGAGGTSGGTMFGGATQAQARGSAADAAPMAIKLSAISGVSPSQHEPQQRAADVPASPTNASRLGGPLPDMAAEQLADASIQKLDVRPEHEGVVRRLFSRQ